MARYLSSTSASSSRAAAHSATPGVPSSKGKPSDPRPGKPTSRNTAQGTSTLKPSKSASHISGPVPARASGPKAAGSVNIPLGPSSSSPTLTKKAAPKEQVGQCITSAPAEYLLQQRPAPADPVTRDRPNTLTTPDVLQQAAQTQSWLYMSASLANAYAAAERSAAEALEQRRAELSAQEADIADARVRFDAERLLNFYEELLAHEVHYSHRAILWSRC